MQHPHAPSSYDSEVEKEEGELKKARGEVSEEMNWKYKCNWRMY